LSDLPAYQQAIAEADAAAASGDLATAADALRRAATLQASTLGPSHPDLANTLNNLGVVAELRGLLDEAEASYRRAAAMAEASLPADHPFVETSRRNLREFCEARYIPLDRESVNTTVATVPPETPPAPDAPVPPSLSREALAVLAEPTLPATLSERVRPSAVPEPMRPTSVTPPMASFSSASPPARASRWPVIAAVVVFGAIGTWWSLNGGSFAPPANDPTPTPTPSTARPAPAPAAAPVTSEAVPAPAAAPPPAATPAVPARPEPFPHATGPAARGAGSAIEIADARVCRGLDTRGQEWTCTAPSDSAAPGTFYFLTRLVTPRDAAVEHRWYRGDRLVRTKPIAVKASGAPGYRAYSQHVVDGAGDWRVDLVTRDGQVLRSVRFSIR